jgi:hypothetical protein
MSSHPSSKWFAVINDTSIPAPKQAVKVEVLKVQGSVPHDHVLVRDFNSPHDAVLKDNDLVDLAEGNVFYSRRHDEVKPNGTCPSGPAKRAFSVNDEFEVIVVAEQTRESLLELFSIGGTVQLYRDYESPRDEVIDTGTPLLFKDGPVFYTRGKIEQLVDITIGGKPFKVVAGNYTGAQIKKIGGVPPADDLEQIIEKKIVPIADTAPVCIKGGEVFIHHPNSGGSS